MKEGIKNGISAYVVKKGDLIILVGGDNLQSYSDNKYFGVGLKVLFDMITISDKWEKCDDCISIRLSDIPYTMRKFLNVMFGALEKDPQPKKDFKADFTTTNDGKYMAVISKDKIFIVSRRGRNLNRYGVQYCLDEYHLRMWNEALHDAGIKWSDGISRQERPALYEIWSGIFKDAHIREAKNAMQS